MCKFCGPYEPLPPAAPREAKAASCVECGSFNVLWSRDTPALFPLTLYGIGARTLCRRCALVLAVEKSTQPFGPDPETVRAYITQRESQLPRA